MIMPVLELCLAWLTRACSPGTEEVESDEDYARGTEGQGEHGYACEEGSGTTGGREGAFAEAID